MDQIDLTDKLIQCQTCFRTFHTQAQFGQHSRICKGGGSVNRKFIDINSQPYKYCFLERQTKDKLEIKSRFLLRVTSASILWKDVAKVNGLHDSGIALLLKMKELEKVHVAIRHRKESGMIVANFVVRSVKQTKESIHSAKMTIERAVDAVKNKLPEHVQMDMHLCSVKNCKELVIRDTEGYCSRHRAQKYHKLSTQKKAKKVRVSKKEKTNKSKIAKKTSADTNMAATNHNNGLPFPFQFIDVQSQALSSQQQFDNYDMYNNIQQSHHCNEYNHTQNVYNNVYSSNVPNMFNMNGDNARSNVNMFSANNIGNIFNHVNMPNVHNVTHFNNNSTFYVMNNYNQNVQSINSLINQSNINYVGDQQTMPGTFHLNVPNINQTRNAVQNSIANQTNITPQSHKRKLDFDASDPTKLTKKRRLCQMQFSGGQNKKSLPEDSNDGRRDTSVDKNVKEVAQLIVDSLSQRPSSNPLLLNELIDFVNSNSYVLETPSSLHGVPINQSPLRKNGMNIISVDYSTQVPNPKQLLRKNGQLVVFGPKKDTQEFLNNIGETQLFDTSNSIRFPQFCQQLAQNYLAFVPAPDWLVGSTLAQTPQLSQSGITALAINFQVQHPNHLANTPIKANDMLLCCFNSANDKDQQLIHAFDRIKNELQKQKS